MTMLDLPARKLDARPVTTAPVLDIVVPVYNEQDALRPSVHRLHRYLTQSFPLPWRITIADNASTDATLDVAEELELELPGVRVVHLAQKGRGRALRATWGGSDAAVLAYTDVDLSTDLAALLPLVAPLVSGHSDLAIGTRLGNGSRVVRGPKREVISRAYNAIVRATLRTRFSDAQCGFKAIRSDRARELLPLVEDDGWFFDTELLVVAERAGLRIHEVPVDWVDDADSRVDIVATAVADLRGIVRLTRNTLPSQVARFAVIGVISTLAYLGLYVALRGALGAFAANTVALAVTAVANTAANRRLTFGVTGRHRRARHQLQGLAVFVSALVITTISLALLRGVDPDPSRSVELTVLVLANLVGTMVRFLALRWWVFRVA